MSKSLSLVLLILGIALLIWTGFSYTKRENLIDAGPIQVSVGQERTIDWPPFLGVALVVAGAAGYARAKRKLRS